MKYLEKKFSSPPASDKYRNGWDKTFGAKSPSDRRMLRELATAGWISSDSSPAKLRSLANGPWKAPKKPRRGER